MSAGMVAGFDYGTFDATAFKPSNGGAGMHPCGIFSAKVIDAKIEPTKEGGGAMYSVTLKTDVGEITRRYNFWNTNPETVRIAKEQFTSVCIAVNYFKFDWNKTGGRELINAPMMIEVLPQLVHSEPGNKQSPKMPSPTLTEVTRVFSITGIDPVAPNNKPVVPMVYERDEKGYAIKSGAASPVALSAGPGAAPNPGAPAAAPAPAPVAQAGGWTAGPVPGAAAPAAPAPGPVPRAVPGAVPGAVAQPTAGVPLPGAVPAAAPAAEATEAPPWGV